MSASRWRSCLTLAHGVEAASSSLTLPPLWLAFVPRSPRGHKMRGTSLRSCMILLFVALALSPARGQTLRTQLIEAIEGTQPCGNTGIRVFTRDERRAVVVAAEVTGGVVEGTITVF